MENPICIIVTGRPGSGKTTLAKKLGVQLCLPVLSRDEIKEGYVVSSGMRHDELPNDANWKATDTFFKAARLLLESGVSIVIEAAFQHKVWNLVIPEWIELSRTHILICDVDPVLCAKRHLKRGLDNPSREKYHGDMRVRHFKETGQFLEPGPYTKPKFNCPTLCVETIYLMRILFLPLSQKPHRS